jgi:hypothetical protein
MKYIKGFFLFWYDFIVGDAWELAVGVVAILILLYVLLQLAPHSTANVYAAIFFPLAIVALLMFSIWRVRKPQ